MEFQHKYAVIGAGAVSKSLIGRLPARGVELGPVAAVSYRVASRLANSLKSGFAVREPDELASAAAVLLHSPPDQLGPLLELLQASKLAWPGRALIICDCEVPASVLARLRHSGASIAVARQFGLSGRVVIEGSGRALLLTHRMAREARLQATEIRMGSGDVFDAAVTLSSTAVTPLIDKAAALLRVAGVRDVDAPRLASALVEQAAGGYAHSGKQSWNWYMRAPEARRILAQSGAAESETGDLFGELLLFALEAFEKHPELAEALRENLARRLNSAE